MKRIILFAISCAFLTACHNAPKEKDPNELTPGLMQPVDGSGTSEGSFGWDNFQTTPMPASMK